MIIAVIDGLGGGIGAQLVQRIRQALGSEVEILALGTNASATERMLRAGASRGASGENAICVSTSWADVIVGPIGIVIPNSMLGEITPRMAQAVIAAPGRKLLLPIEQPHLEIVGLPALSLAQLIEVAVRAIQGAGKSVG